VYGSSAARLRNFTFTGNVFFFGRILLGGDSPLENIVFEQNMTYNAGVELGFGETVNNSVNLRNNYISAGVLFSRLKNVSVTDNTIFNHIKSDSPRSIGITPPPDFNPADYRIDRNNYMRCTRDGLEFRFPGKLYTFAQWQQLGFDAGSKYTAHAAARPAGVKAFLRKNQYDPNRATLVLYNWDHSDELPVDLSSFLRPGDEYELRNAQDYFNDVVKATYDGSPVNLRMTGRQVAVPVGRDTALEGSTLPEAGVFILLKVPPASHPKPKITAVLNGASRTAEPMAPGTLVVLAGEYLGPDDPLVTTPTAGVVPGTLADIRVRFDGMAAPVLYASSSEVGVIVPNRIHGANVSQVQIENSFGASDPVPVQVVNASPALFTVDGSGQGQASAINADGVINGPDAPASPGTLLVLAATGLGHTQSTVSDGTIPAQPDFPLLPVKVRLSETLLDPEFVPGTGVPPLGVTWMRVRIPNDLRGGQTPVSISAGERLSTASVTVSVR
jgi:uncharacterized protein (TIGR03437 family)